MNELFAQISQKKNFYIQASLLSGILLGLAWYQYLQILLLVALLPFLLLVEKIAREETQKPYKKLLFWTWLTFLFWNITATWWLWNAIEWLVLVVFPLKALIQSLPVLLALYIRRSTEGKFWYFPLFTAWLAWEYVDLNWALSWCWLILGNSLGFMPSLAQWYEYTGVLGGSLWFLSVNVLLFKLLFTQNANKITPIFVIFAPIIFSLVLYFNFEEKGEKIEIAVIQPNLDCYEEKFERNPATGQASKNFVPIESQVARFIELSKKVVTPQTDFLLFPETSLHQDMDEDNVHHTPSFIPIINYLAENKNLSLLSGADTYKYYTEGQQTKTSRATQDGRHFYDYFNTGLFLSDSGTIDVYHKSKLVIGAETNPFQTSVPMLGPIVFKDLTISLGVDEQRKVFFNSRKQGIAPVICYESIYGEFVGEYIKKGAGCIAVITNDGWWGNTSGHVQHLAHSRLRAIETRRDVFRSANTGISCYINARGDMGEKLDYAVLGALNLKGFHDLTLTFYTQFGDYIGRLSAFLVFFFWISAVALKIKNKKAKKRNQ